MQQLSHEQCQRVAEVVAARSGLTFAQRLFHGRGQAYPGLEYFNIEWFPPVAQVVLYRELAEESLQQLAQALMIALGARCEAVVAQHRCRPMAPRQWLIGEPREQLTVSEGPLRFHIHLGGNQNAGLFVDMASAREWLRQQAAGKRVLNLFAYTCGFSVAAIAGGAREVVNVDMSKAALAQGRDNHRLNGHPLERVRYLGHDILRSWGKIRKFGPYDLVICDPPSLQKGSLDVRRDYAKILRRLPEWLAPDGEALLCLNAPELDSDFLQQQVAEHCPELTFVERLPLPEAIVERDPESALKVLRFRWQPR